MSSSIYKDTQQVTPPWNEMRSIAKSIAIDSRQRDCAAYKTPSYYTIDLEHKFKNVTGIELKGAIFPKSSYNIHSSNNKIDFSIGDFVVGFIIIDRGAGYASAPSIQISAPTGAGVTATAFAIISPNGTLSNIVITNGGSGYVPSTPPFVFISPPNNTKQSRSPRVKAIVGNYYTATLRIGEYEIGGNPMPGSLLPSGLLLEIQNSMNHAVNGGAYNPISISPFCARIVSQYPSLNAPVGSPESFDTNGCRFNRIQIINTQSSVWEFLWCTGQNKVISAASVFGFNTVDSGIGKYTPGVMAGLDVIIPAGTAIRGCFDYNLKNDPDYVIMTIAINNKKMDRLKSPDDSIDETFAVLIFDNNNPETLHDLSASPSGSITSVGGVQYLQGGTGKGIFWRDAGAIKPIKGYDFDSKKLFFKPPIASVGNMTVQFTKFGLRAGGVPLYYNMEGREHVLLFEFTANDQKTHQRE